MTITVLHTVNPHDQGFDLIVGTDITSRPIGRIYLDRSDPANVGLVVRIPEAGYELEGEREIAEDNTIAINEALRRMGWELDPQSFREVSDLLLADDC